MATNIVYEQGVQLDLAVTNHLGAGANPASGDPVLVGQIPGVALTDEGADGLTTVKTDGVAELAVTGDNAGGTGVAIAVGDIVFLDDADGEINADATNGVRFGYALGAVGSLATATIQVKIGY